MEYLKHSIADWRAVQKALAKGASIRDAASKTGISRSTVHRWSRMDSPPDWMWLNLDANAESSFEVLEAVPFEGRLRYEHRLLIYACLQLGRAHREMADAIGCGRSTVSRELARAEGGPYDPRLAQLDADRKAERPRDASSTRTPGSGRTSRTP